MRALQNSTKKKVGLNNLTDFKIIDGAVRRSISIKITTHLGDLKKRVLGGMYNEQCQ